MAKRLYFAYGSNLNEAQMALRCPDSKTVGIAKLENHRFLINDRGVASIAESQDKVVYGLLWSISESDERQLDRYEGVRKGYYRKSTVSVRPQVNQTEDALVYIASSNEHGKPRPGYMEKIIRAAVGLGFPTQNLEELNSWLVTDAQSA
jgi:gamma-glutamylcyclotransferase (GGCT)/AIG2-like uncharacterized protein YtfP